MLFEQISYLAQIVASVGVVTFELSCGAHLCGLFRTASGGTWWRSAKQAGFPPEFVLDVDAVLARSAEA
jgi:hypothetical protein